jgi:hypothetical protein
MIADTIYFCYFLIHIPITVFMDATFAIPYEWQLPIQRQLNAFHYNENKDFLAVNSPLWMRIFVVWELIFQLPFFIYAVIDYTRNGRKGYSVRLWTMFFLYGFNAGFTTLVCLIYVYSESAIHGLNTTEMWNLVGLYTPTMVLPFYMMWDFGCRIVTRLTDFELETKEKIL